MQPGVQPGDPGHLGTFGQQVPPQGVADLQSALAKAAQMQQALIEAQKQIADTQVTGQAGGGLVEVTLNGNGQVVGVRIDPQVVDPNDVDTLQDLVVGALQNAGENMRDTVKTILGPVAAASGRPMPES
ncbi:MAG: YbaB/EbfC family nucleoid-associated protein [Actinomycetia bacterium]|nr:YbaB/EbfC family nucleoid-associated protein [Actinomycetes bacterium]